MNSEQIKGKFMQFEGVIREKWGKISTDDLQEINGRRERLIGKIRERYGVAQEEAEREVDEWWTSVDKREEELRPPAGLKS